jgi:hypothetical protein
MKVLTLALASLATLAPVTAFAGFDVPVAVPEPATLTIMAIGVAGAVIASRFRKKK